MGHLPDPMALGHGNALPMKARNIFTPELMKQARPRNLVCGELICCPEEDAQSVFMIKRGSIKIYRNTRDGREVIVELLSKGEIFGESAVLLDSPFDCYAEALEPTQILQVPANLFRKAIAADPAYAWTLLGHVAQNVQRMEEELERSILLNAPQKVGCYLLRQIAGAQKRSHGHSGFCPALLPFSKALVAFKLGMTPETMSRSIRKLVSLGLLRERGRTMVGIDPENLTQYCCRSCSQSFPCQSAELAP